jgi:hypothetical protein
MNKDTSIGNISIGSIFLNEDDDFEKNLEENVYDIKQAKESFIALKDQQRILDEVKKENFSNKLASYKRLEIKNILFGGNNGIG